MVVLWWIAGILLILFSFVLWLSGLAGRDGVLRIGKEAVAESRKEPRADIIRSVRLQNVIVGLIGILVGLTIVLMVAF